MRAPKDVDAQMTYLYERPLLTFKQEQHLFRKMNYLKHRLKKLQERIDPARVRVGELAEAEQIAQGIKDTRDVLIECNLRLVHKLASQHMQTTQPLDELKSDAHISLMRAVEKFDYGRGFKFSTYATWAIVKNFARSIPDEYSHRTRYVTGHEEMLEHRPGHAHGRGRDDDGGRAGQAEGEPPARPPRPPHPRGDPHADGHRR